jgi:hypothetical protein
MGKLHDLLFEKFKVNTRPNVNPLVSSVGTTPTKVLDNNPDRLAWFIVNLSSNVVYLHFDNSVSSSKGIAVSPNGGFASMVYDEDFHAVGWEIWAKATGEDSSIYVVEIIAT